MRILLANKFFWVMGGAERVFFLERALLLSQGHTVIDFAMEHPNNLPSRHSRWFVSQCDYHGRQGAACTLHSAATFIHSREAVRKLAELVDQERPQMAHLHGIYHQLTPSIIPLLKRKGVKTVLTLHDYKLACPAYLLLNQGRICTKCLGGKFHHAATSGCQRSLPRGLLLAAEAYYHAWARSYDAVDRFIAPSRFMAELMGRDRVPPDKLSVLYNGIDLADCHPTWQDHGYVLYFGRLSHEKGVATLLSVHAGLDRPMPLRIVGTGPLEDDLRRRYPQAQFMGYKSGTELYDLVANASVVVVPSEWYENCSMVVLEAMALGKPVLASRTGGIPEQIDHGSTGMLYEMSSREDLTDKLQALWTDPGLRQTMGRAARRKVESEFSMQAHAQGLLDIYAQVLGAV